VEVASARSFSLSPVRFSCQAMASATVARNLSDSGAVFVRVNSLASARRFDRTRSGIWLAAAK
jgi:hypothetical protein